TTALPVDPIPPGAQGIPSSHSSTTGVGFFCIRHVDTQDKCSIKTIPVTSHSNVDYLPFRQAAPLRQIFQSQQRQSPQRQTPPQRQGLRQESQQRQSPQRQTHHNARAYDKRVNNDSPLSARLHHNARAYDK
ncbi:hypothetical protein BaRGS_00036952, partial [Batillaria attramentaria]